MNKSIAALWAVLIAGAGVGGYFLWKSKSDPLAPEIQGQPGNAPLPEGPKAENPAEQKTYSAEAGEGLAAIQARMRELGLYASSRQNIISQYGVLDNLLSGVTYRSGTNSVLNLLFGNVLNTPLYPASNGAWTAQLNSIKDTQGFEELTANAGGNPATAFQVWQTVLQLPDGRSFWYPGIEQLIDAGQFGKRGPADKNKSERYDAYTRDMQKVAENLLIASRKYEDALRQQAIQDLIGSGWKFTGL